MKKTELPPDLEAFEDSLRALKPASAPEKLGQEMGAQLDVGVERIVRFPIWRRAVPGLAVAAAVVLVAVALLRQPSVDSEPEVALQPAGAEREVIGIENLGLVHLEDGHPYQGYRVRVRDTGHWATPEPLGEGRPRNTLHLSRENDGIVYLPVVFH